MAIVTIENSARVDASKKPLTERRTDATRTFTKDRQPDCSPASREGSG